MPHRERQSSLSVASARQWFSASLRYLCAACALRDPGSHDWDSAADPRPGVNDYVTIATFDKITDAHIVLGRLAAEGIQATLFDDHMVQMDWLYAIALGGIKLRVLCADAAEARRVLATDYSHDLDDVDVGKLES